MEALVLVFALSFDAFVSGFSYGTNKIRIPFRSILIIGMVCSILLGFSLMFGQFAGNFLPSELTRVFCFSILFLLALTKLFNYGIKAWIRKSHMRVPKVSFHIMDVHFLLQVYCDSTKADADCSKSLSSKEALALAIALSVDGLAAGFGAGMVEMNVIITILLSFITSIFTVFSGCFLGNRIAKKINFDFEWLSGCLLILLALSKLKLW